MFKLLIQSESLKEVHHIIFCNDQLMQSNDFFLVYGLSIKKKVLGFTLFLLVVQLFIIDDSSLRCAMPGEDQGDIVMTGTETSLLNVACPIDRGNVELLIELN